MSSRSFVAPAGRLLVLGPGGGMSAQPSIDPVWGRIRKQAGKEFKTRSGLPFTYTASGNVLHTSRTNRNLSKGEFAKVLKLWPVKAPGQVRDVVQGSAHIWVTLNDSRVLGERAAAGQSAGAESQESVDEPVMPLEAVVAASPVRRSEQSGALRLKSAYSEFVGALRSVRLEFGPNCPATCSGGITARRSRRRSNIPATLGWRGKRLPSTGSDRAASRDSSA